MKLKRINRGLVLGAVLIVGTAIYVAADNSRFKSNKKDIIAAAENFTQALASSNEGDEQQINDQWKQIIKDYYTDYSNENDYNFTKSDILSEMNNNYYYNNMGHITKCIAETSNFSVSKYGTNGAKVTFDCSFYFEYDKECPPWLSFDGLWSLDGGSNYDENGNLILSKEPVAFTETIEESVELYMINTDNGWKVASSNANMSSSYSEDVTDELAEDDSLTDESLADENTSSSPASQEEDEASTPQQDSAAKQEEDSNNG